MNIKEFISMVELMREAQKNGYSCFTTKQLKQLRTIEKTVDEKIKAYHKEELEKLQGSLFVDEH